MIASSDVAFGIVFGLFVVAMVVLAIFVIRFAGQLGRRRGDAGTPGDTATLPKKPPK